MAVQLNKDSATIERDSLSDIKSALRNENISKNLESISVMENDRMFHISTNFVNEQMEKGRETLKFSLDGDTAVPFERERTVEGKKPEITKNGQLILNSLEDVQQAVQKEQTKYKDELSSTMYLSDRKEAITTHPELKAVFGIKDAATAFTKENSDTFNKDTSEKFIRSVYEKGIDALSKGGDVPRLDAVQKSSGAENQANNDYER